MSDKSDGYEKNFAILEEITESLNKDEIGIDDLVEKTKTALEAAKKCLKILNSQRGEFKKLEVEFSELIKKNSDLSNESKKEGDDISDSDISDAEPL